MNKFRRLIYATKDARAFKGTGQPWHAAARDRKKLHLQPATAFISSLWYLLQQDEGWPVVFKPSYCGQECDKVRTCHELKEELLQQVTMPKA